MALLVPSRPAPRSLPVPTTLHVGSGKNFKPDCLNLDVDARWRPDVVFDLEKPLPPDGLTVTTERFGPVTLGDDCFEAIVAQDVLEHLRELTTAMTTMLRLLRVGGVLKVVVPYELSLGAWSDPTHVRAFNERSFDYFTNWSWYLGWSTHNFAVKHLEFVGTPYGIELMAQGKTLDEALRTPRAVEQIYIELQKRELSAEDKQTVAFYHDRQLA
jgi:hypothetical protein